MFGSTPHPMALALRLFNRKMKVVCLRGLLITAEAPLTALSKVKLHPMLLVNSFLRVVS
jgi:hypothetical protein